MAVTKLRNLTMEYEALEKKIEALDLEKDKLYEEIDKVAVERKEKELARWVATNPAKYQEGDILYRKDLGYSNSNIAGLVRVLKVLEPTVNILNNYTDYYFSKEYCYRIERIKRDGTYSKHTELSNCSSEGQLEEVKGYEGMIWAGDSGGDVEFFDCGPLKKDAIATFKKEVKEKYPEKGATLFYWYQDGDKIEVIEYDASTKKFTNGGE